jgi:SAP domain.
LPLHAPAQVNELRQELEARTLSAKGLKSQLIARLTKAIKTEAEKAEEEEGKKGDDAEPQPKQELEDKDDEKRKKEVNLQTKEEKCSNEEITVLLVYNILLS